MTTVNLAIRFLLELAGLGAVAYWGYQTPSSQAGRIALAVAAPVAIGFVWARVAAPRASNSLGQRTRMVVGSVVLIACDLALLTVGQVRLGIVLAAAVTLNTLILLALGAPEPGGFPPPAR